MGSPPHTFWSSHHYLHFSISLTEVRAVTLAYKHSVSQTTYLNLHIHWQEWPEPGFWSFCWQDQILLSPVRSLWLVLTNHYVFTSSTQTMCIMFFMLVFSTSKIWRKTKEQWWELLLSCCISKLQFLLYICVKEVKYAKVVDGLKRQGLKNNGDFPSMASLPSTFQWALVLTDITVRQRKE